MQLNFEFIYLLINGQRKKPQIHLKVYRITSSITDPFFYRINTQCLYLLLRLTWKCNLMNAMPNFRTNKNIQRHFRSTFMCFNQFEISVDEPRIVIQKKFNGMQTHVLHYTISMDGFLRLKMWHIFNYIFIMIRMKNTHTNKCARRFTRFDSIPFTVNRLTTEVCSISNILMSYSILLSYIKYIYNICGFLLIKCTIH